MQVQKPRILPPSGIFPIIQQTVQSEGLHTVCQEAHCPNQAECWSGGTATFMVLGDTCTRGCKFCNVKTFYKPSPPDPNEPAKLAAVLKKWNLSYIVLTSVDRDDLPDQGASHFASCIRAVKEANPHVRVEVLIPDFRGDLTLLHTVLDAHPDVLAHNVETVKRLQGSVRDPRAGYDQSLSILAEAKTCGFYTKSSLMLGFGETDREVLDTFRDLRAIGVDFLTIGQYLRPSQMHHPVVEYLTEEKFRFFQTMAEEMGFRYVAAGSLVRSSYRAGEFFIRSVIDGKRI